MPRMAINTGDRSDPANHFQTGHYPLAVEFDVHASVTIGRLRSSECMECGFAVFVFLRSRVFGRPSPTLLAIKGQRTEPQHKGEANER